MLAGDTSSFPEAVSADGTVVVGESLDETNNVNHAIRLVGAGAAQFMASPIDAEGGCRAYGVSTNGALITGTCDLLNPPTGTPRDRPFKYTPASGIVYVGPSPMAADTGISATGLSDDGNVLVGHTTSPYLGVRWTAATGWVLLGRLTTNGENNATGVNQNGSVIVGYDAFSLSVPWKWTAAAGEVALAQPSDATTGVSVWDVSPNGNTMIGDYYASGSSITLRWTNGAVAALGPGAGRATSADGSVVVGSNNGVATVWNSTGAHTVASLLGTTSDLSGWTLEFANDVSDNGKVVVGNGKHNGVSEGWIAHLP